SWPTGLLDNPSVGELACDLLLFFFFVRGVKDEGIYRHFYFGSRLGFSPRRTMILSRLGELGFSPGGRGLAHRTGSARFGRIASDHKESDARSRSMRPDPAKQADRTRCATIQSGTDASGSIRPTPMRCEREVDLEAFKPCSSSFLEVLQGIEVGPLPHKHNYQNKEGIARDQQMKSFREAIGGFLEPSAITGRERVEGATAERGEYELDEEADDPEDPPRPNTFLARAVAEATAEEEGDRGNVGQPYSPHYKMDPEAVVDLLGDIELELVERRGGGGHGRDDDDDFERLMEGLPCTQSRRRGSSTQDAPPSQSIRPPTSSQLAKGKKIAQESLKELLYESHLLPQHKKRRVGFLVVDHPLDIADAETLDPNAEDETPSPLDSPRLPNSASHDSMTTGGSSSDARGDGGGNGGGGGGDGGQGGGDGDSGQGGGGGGMAFIEEQFYQGATQDSSHGTPLRYNRRQKFRPGSQARGSPVDSHSYDTMISDFERMSTQESVGSYGDHSYHPESTSTDYSSGYRPYSGYTATAGYLGPSPYMYPPPAFSVHIPVQVFAPVEDVQMAQLNVIRPGSQLLLTGNTPQMMALPHPSSFIYISSPLTRTLHPSSAAALSYRPMSTTSASPGLGNSTSLVQRRNRPRRLPGEGPASAAMAHNIEDIGLREEEAE
ncbi:hypothetical protein Taro_030543, partial [Colocasia esculenta]|nr:hypothetical protein [Colocasia esculenta]